MEDYFEQNMDTLMDEANFENFRLRKASEASDFDNKRVMSATEIPRSESLRLGVGEAVLNPFAPRQTNRATMNHEDEAVWGRPKPFKKIGSIEGSRNSGKRPPAFSHSVIQFGNSPKASIHDSPPAFKEVPN
jgi:hypothetical protein